MASRNKTVKIGNSGKVTSKRAASKVSSKASRYSIKNANKMADAEDRIANAVEKQRKEYEKILALRRQETSEDNKLAANERKRAERLQKQTDYQNELVEKVKLQNNYEHANLINKQKIAHEQAETLKKQLEEAKAINEAYKNDKNIKVKDKNKQKKLVDSLQEKYNTWSKRDESTKTGIDKTFGEGFTNKLVSGLGNKDTFGSSALGLLVGGGASLLNGSNGDGIETMASSFSDKMSGLLGDKLNPIVGTLNTIFSVVNAIHDSLDASVDKAMNLFSEYQGSVDARLQGFDELLSGNFMKMVNTLNKTLAGNSLVDNTKYLENLNKLVEKGIAYNVEQRSLIATIGDKLVSTFNAANDNLLRLVRLQQSDVTYSQLGSEAQLTQFLNSTFQDTEYLNIYYDTVEGTLVDALSTMSKDAATSFEYAVQKWLSSLYSVGMSEDTITTIAQGITYLATGNVSELTGNTSLNNLMAMSAQKAGLSYSELFTNGMNYVDVNNLMMSMIEYLQDIADNTSNQVTRSEYSNIFGTNISDLRAVQNLSNSDLANIYSSNINYALAMDQYYGALGELSNRTTIAEKVDNVINNLLYNFGASISDDTGQYLLWKSVNIMNKISDMFGESESGAAGILSKVVNWISGVSSSISLALGLVETLGDLKDSISAQMENGDDFGFNWSEWTSRGTDYSSNLGVSSLADIVTGLSESFKSSNIYANSSGEASLLSFEENANATTISGSTVQSNESIAAVRTVSDVYAQLFDNQRTIRVILASVEPQANESIISDINGSSVAKGEGNNILENTKKTADILEKKLDTSTSDIATQIKNHLVEVKYY